MVPAIMSTILKTSPPASGMLQSLRLVWSAGAPLDQRTQDQMYRLLVPSARVVQVWGMTEAGWITTFTWPEKDHTGSVGRLLPGVEAKYIYRVDFSRLSKADDPQACRRGWQHR